MSSWDPQNSAAEMPHLHSWLLACLLALSSCVNRPGDPAQCNCAHLPTYSPPPTILQENRPPSQPWLCHSCNGYPPQKRKQGLGQTNRHSFGPTTSWTLLQLHPHALPFPKPPGSFLLTWLSCALLAPAAISHPPMAVSCAPPNKRSS